MHHKDVTGSITNNQVQTHGGYIQPKSTVLLVLVCIREGRLLAFGCAHLNERVVVPSLCCTMHCCVPGCTSNNRARSKEGVPSTPSQGIMCYIAHEWIAKIHRDVGAYFQVKEHKKVYSLYSLLLMSGSQRRQEEKKLTPVTHSKLKRDAELMKHLWSTPAVSGKLRQCVNCYHLI